MELEVKPSMKTSCSQHSHVILQGSVMKIFRIIVPSSVEIGSVVLEKKTKMVKFYDNDDNNDNDDDGLRTNFDQKSSLEPSAQVS